MDGVIIFGICVILLFLTWAVNRNWREIEEIQRDIEELERGNDDTPSQ